MPDDLDLPLTEDWLVAAGFRWHQFTRQPERHWLLWLGDAVEGDRFGCYEDLGIEVAPDAYRGPDLPSGWFCWLRGDAAGRYHRFIHIRTILTPRDVVGVIQGLTGREFVAADCMGGCFLSPERAEWRRRDRERLDQRLMREGHPWADVERDEARGRALPEHMQVAEDARAGKLPR